MSQLRQFPVAFKQIMSRSEAEGVVQGRHSWHFYMLRQPNASCNTVATAIKLPAMLWCAASLLSYIFEELTWRSVGE